MGIQYFGMSRRRLDRPSLMVPHDSDILVGLLFLRFFVFVGISDSLCCISLPIAVWCRRESPGRYGIHSWFFSA